MLLKSILTFLLIVIHFSTFGQELSQKLDDFLLSTYNKKNKFNGTVLIAKNGQILLSKGYGYKNKVEEKLNDTSTIYQIGSITKTFTSAVILHLCELKQLSLSDKITKYISNYPEGDEITIENLITHTSGIFDYLASKKYAKENFSEPISLDTLITFFKSEKRLFKSGEKFSYTNSGYILLAFIIEKVTGKKYEQVVHDVIFEPLQMSHSGFDFKNLSDMNKALNYENISKKKLVSEPIFDSTHAPGCGSIYSTVMDLYKWDRALYTNKIVSALSLEKAYKPYISNYGYGWFIFNSFGKLNVCHGGGTPGFHSHLQRFIDDDICIILLSNNAYCDLSEITNRLASIIFDKPYEKLY